MRAAHINILLLLSCSLALEGAGSSFRLALAAVLRLVVGLLGLLRRSLCGLAVTALLLLLLRLGGVRLLCLLLRLGRGTTTLSTITAGGRRLLALSLLFEVVEKLHLFIFDRLELLLQLQVLLVLLLFARLHLLELLCALFRFLCLRRLGRLQAGQLLLSFLRFAGFLRELTSDIGGLLLRSL